MTYPDTMLAYKRHDAKGNSVLALQSLDAAIDECQDMTVIEHYLKPLRKKLNDIVYADLRHEERKQAGLISTLITALWGLGDKKKAERAE